jgi:hypothetical protein
MLTAAMARARSRSTDAHERTFDAERSALYAESLVRCIETTGG